MTTVIRTELQCHRVEPLLPGAHCQLVFPVGLVPFFFLSKIYLLFWWSVGTRGAQRFFFVFKSDSCFVSVTELRTISCERHLMPETSTLGCLWLINLHNLPSISISTCDAWRESFLVIDVALALLCRRSWRISILKSTNNEEHQS